MRKLTLKRLTFGEDSGVPMRVVKYEFTFSREYYQDALATGKEEAFYSHVVQSVRNYLRLAMEASVNNDDKDIVVSAPNRITSEKYNKDGEPHLKGIVDSKITIKTRMPRKKKIKENE